MQLGEQSALGRTGPPRAPGDGEQRCPGRICPRSAPFAPGSGCREGPAPACLLSSPLKAVGLWPCSFLPSSLRLETSAPPQALTKAPLTLSPSDFPSRGFEELGSTGGGTGPINPFLPVEGRPGDLFDEQEGSTIPWGASEHWHVVAERFCGRRFGN